MENKNLFVQRFKKNSFHSHMWNVCKVFHRREKGKKKKIWARVILLSQGVLDHTDFSFSRVERDEVTHCASVLPLYQPKISLPLKKVPLSLHQAVSHVMSRRCQTLERPLQLQPLNTWTAASLLEWRSNGRSRGSDRMNRIH